MALSVTHARTDAAACYWSLSIGPFNNLQWKLGEAGRGTRKRGPSALWSETPHQSSDQVTDGGYTAYYLGQNVLEALCA